MKRNILIALTVIAILALGVSLAAADELTAPVTPGTNFVDADGDGVCDLYGSQAAMGQNRGQAAMSGGSQLGFVDADADGVCDNAGLNQSAADFIDADGDGTCDNAGAGAHSSQQMQAGQGRGRMNHSN